MNTSWIVGILVAIVVIAGGWYWWSMQTPTPATAGPSTTAGINGSADQGNMGQPDNGTVQQPTGDGTPISANLALGTSGNTQLGTYLVGYTGMTLYTTLKDTGSVSSCYDACAANWPPYVVSSSDRINLQAGVNGKVGTTSRMDGSIQLTYNGKPLYSYVGDKTNADTNGQGSSALWYVVKP